MIQVKKTTLTTPQVLNELRVNLSMELASAHEDALAFFNEQTGKNEDSMAAASLVGGRVFILHASGQIGQIILSSLLDSGLLSPDEIVEMEL